MKNSGISVFVIGLALGLVVGVGAGAALALRASPAAVVPSVGKSEPRPAADPARAAIAGWRGLRGADGSPADFATRADAFRALLARLDEAQFPGLLSPLASSKDATEQRLLRIGFDVWCARAPEAAARWAAALPVAWSERGFGWSDFCVQAARAWAERDLMAATSWACALPDEELAGTVARALIGRVATQDEARALALAGGRGKAFSRQLYAEILTVLAKRDPAAAVRRLGPLVWNRQDGWDLMPGLTAWAKLDMDAAAAWVLAQPMSGGYSHSNVLWNMTKEPAAMLAAVVRQPDFKGRQQVLGSLFFDWGQDKPEAAVAWLRGVEDADLRNALVEQAA
ncbi:MAG: hypothetical protein RIQ79_2199, partial [Verrucomicrobiota bacterium]